MNLQGMSIIFIVIFLPIILISTYYIQREVDTITLQTSYDTKLIDATTDAVSAFEINTANEDLSSVSDSLRSIIEASNNVFTTTLATNMGMSNASKSKLLAYIPAVVYTLYDGYYIYAPTRQPRVAIDDEGVYVTVGTAGVTGGSGVYEYNPNGTETIQNDENYGKLLYCMDGDSYEHTDELGRKRPCKMCTTDISSSTYTTSYILKSFIPYSSKYEFGNKDITINYTLDNFLTVYITEKVGAEKENWKYWTKSGYLIDYTKVSYNGAPISSLNLGLEEVDKWVENQNSLSITYDGIELKFERKIVDGKEIIENSALSSDYKGDNNKTYDVESAIKYYLKAAIFSEWFLNEVGDLTEGDIQYSDDDEMFMIDNGNFSIFQGGTKLTENQKLFYEYSDNKTIFKKNSAYDVANFNSNFYEHKRNVIKNSIQYNLNLAMAIYNSGQGDEYYQMPILSEPEWDKLLSNISILSFMQGMPCGLKTYNNYAIVTSRNNEIMVNDSEIYYIPCNDDGNEALTTQKLAENPDLANMDNLPIAHRSDCEYLYNDVNSLNKYFQSFPSRDIKYDKEYNSDNRKYEYDHVCNSCYYCLVNSNYLSFSENNVGSMTDEQKNLFESHKEKIKRAELIAIGKIKNNTYKTRAVEISNGLKIDNSIKSFNANNDWGYLLSVGFGNVNDIKDCYEIEVTIKNNFHDHFPIYVSPSLTNTIYINGNPEEKYSYMMYGNDDYQTFRFTNISNWSGDIQLRVDINPDLGTYAKAEYYPPSSIQIVSVTYKYK